MSINRSEAARHQYERTSGQRIGRSNPRRLAGLGDAKRCSDMETSAHADPEGNHGDEISQDEEDSEGSLAALTPCIQVVILDGSWRDRGAITFGRRTEFLFWSREAGMKVLALVGGTANGWYRSSFFQVAWAWYHGERELDLV